MKCPKYAWGFVCLLALAGSAYPADGVSRIKELIENAERSIAEGSDSGRADGLVDTWPVLYWEPEIAALRDELAGSWRLALESFDELAPDDAKKNILLLSCWQVTEKEYGDFLLAVARMAEAGRVSPQLLNTCRNPSEGPLAGYLQRHGRDSAVLEVEAVARKLSCGSVASGRAAGDIQSDLPGPVVMPEGEPVGFGAASGDGGNELRVPAIMGCLVLLGTVGILLSRRKQTFGGKSKKIKGNQGDGPDR